jgi:hypothetical protein
MRTATDGIPTHLTRRLNGPSIAFPHYTKGFGWTSWRTFGESEAKFGPNPFPVPNALVMIATGIAKKSRADVVPMTKHLNDPAFLR